MAVIRGVRGAALLQDQLPEGAKAQAAVPLHQCKNNKMYKIVVAKQQLIGHGTQ